MYQLICIYMAYGSCELSEGSITEVFLIMCELRNLYQFGCMDTLRIARRMNSNDLNLMVSNRYIY